MDRNQEARRGAMAATVNGLSRRRQRSSSLRDSPEEDGAVELQESRFRDRASKKDRDRDRDRHRDRDRDRSSRSKRRRGERLLHGSHREEGGEESSEESVDDEEEEEDEEAAVMALRLQQINPPASVVSTSSSVPDHHLRKNFPAKIGRPGGPWKVAEEIIGVSVPRKARSAFAKRSQECWISGGSNGGEPTPRQASTSPARAATPAAAPTAAPISPSSSNASVRKKMKPIGSKHRPPKVSKTSSIQEAEIEFEIAEVLYGMTRGPTKQETASVSQKPNSRDANGSSNDAKSRGSSPISILPPTELPQSSVLQQNSNLTAVAPKRKRPRPPKLEEERPANLSVPDASVSSATKIEAQEEEKAENSLSKSEKKMPSAVENGCGTEELVNSQIPSIPSDLPQDSVKTKSEPVPPHPEPPKAEPDGLDAMEATEEIPSPVQGSPCAKPDADLEDAITTKPESAVSTEDRPREEKFEIDLMASPSGKSLPERDENMADLVTSQKPLASETETMAKKEIVKAEEEKGVGHVEQAGEVELMVKKTETMQEQEFQKHTVKERVFDLQVDAEKLDKDGDKLQVPKQATKAIENESKAEKAVQSASLPLPMTIAGWPGGLPPIGYMGQIPPQLPAVSMDGGAGSATAMQPPNFLLPPHRPKRCATHFYIAQNINYQRQVARMNPFWPAPAGFAAAQCGTKPCNLNVLPATESAILGNQLQGSFSGKNLSSQDKASGDHVFNDKNAAVMFMDTSQRKQLMLQQATQPPSANNILQAPTFIFPLNQQQPTPVPPSGAVKSATTVSNAASSSSATNSVLGSAASSGSAPGTAATVTFNYANLQANEAQYLAMLQNSGYQFPIPAHVGGPPLYRGSHHPAMPVPFFNGSFYSPQMLHPSQLQQQHIQSQPPAVQLGNQNSGTASGSSSSQKHQQQQQPQGCVGNGGVGISTGFPTLKQCQQPQQNYLQSHHSRQPESEVGNGDSRCSTDSRVSHTQKSVYNHNFSMPVHPQNFTIMSPSALGGGNQGEKQQQQQGLKGGLELNQSQAFAMSFAALSSAAAAASPGLDFSSMAHNHAVFQTPPEAARHGYHMAASAAPSRTAQQKNHHSMEERKAVNDSISSNACGEEERKMKMAGKAPTAMSHTLTFSRPDNDPSISSILGNSVVDSSSKNLNAIPASGSGSRASSRSGVVSPATTTLTNTPNSQYSQSPIQVQLQKQHQQMQQQLAVHAKSASNNPNANLYSERVSSAMGKFPAVSVFPQALAQGSGPTQVPQWKTSTKAGTTPVPSCEASTPSAKSLPQQQGRTQLGVPNSSHTQISFGVNTKSSSCMQQFTSNNPSPSSAAGVAGSPPTSISKSAGGSPRTTDGKACPGTIPSSSQAAKNAPSSSSRKSSPVSGRHVQSILNNSNVSSAQSSVIKPQQQPQQQQQLPKQPFQQPAQQTMQAQAFFSSFYMQAQSPQSTSNSTNSGSYQKRQSEQQQQHNSMSVSSAGMMSLCPPSIPFSGVSTSAAAAAAGNLKGLPSHGFLHPAQFAAQSAANPHLLMSTAIPYIHSVPAVPVKSADQKPAAGNDILHQSWQPEKR